MTERVVRFPDVKINDKPVSVESLDLNTARALAPQFLGLIVDAYSNQFEQGPDKRIPQGTFQAIYGNWQAIVRFRDTKIPSVYDRGGGYYVIRHPRKSQKLLGTLKALPGAAVEPRFKGRFGLAELLVAPNCQRKGLGAALFQAYLSQQEPSQPGVIDALQWNPRVTKWFRRLEFRPEYTSDKLVLENEGKSYVLPCQYYVTKKDITAGSLADRLMASIIARTR